MWICKKSDSSQTVKNSNGGAVNRFGCEKNIPVLRWPFAGCTTEQPDIEMLTKLLMEPFWTYRKSGQYYNKGGKAKNWLFPPQKSSI